MNWRNVPGLRALLVVPFGQLAALPLTWFSGEAEQLRVALKAVCRYEFDNPILRLDRNGETFAFMVTRHQPQPGSPFMEQHGPALGLDPKRGVPFDKAIIEVNAWDNTGSRSVYRSGPILAHPLEPLGKETVKALADALDRWNRGSVGCADCGRDTEAGSSYRYFAAVYCPTCWFGTSGQHEGRGGWQKVEAAETYS